jgi:hypothetical protein
MRNRIYWIIDDFLMTLWYLQIIPTYDAAEYLVLDIYNWRDYQSDVE